MFSSLDPYAKVQICGEMKIRFYAGCADGDARVLSDCHFRKPELNMIVILV